MTDRAPRAAVCVMAKAPVPGRAKTRLSPPLSPEGAARLAAAFAIDTWSAAASLADARPLLARAGPLERFPPPLCEAESFPQPEGDLGARIEGVAAAGLERAEVAILIGSDLPGLPVAYLEQARAALAERDAVLGPSADGGYYLIGLRRRVPGLLRGIPWSSPATRRATAERLRRAGMPAAEIARFDDVDEPQDLVRLRGLLAAGRLEAPATAAALAAL